jgi:putative ABC transport system substrate-binding protein
LTAGVVKEGLRELGWVEGKNLRTEIRAAGGRYERLPELAAELVRLKVDVIVAPNTPAATAARNATRTTPIVFTSLADPVAQGFAATLARPGSNTTGLTTTSDTKMYGKQLELLREVLPGVSRVAVLCNPANAFTTIAVRETEATARLLGIQLQLLEARDPSAFGAAFGAMTRERAAALFVLPDTMFNDHAPRLADLAVSGRLPTMFGFRLFVDAGGLMSYGPDRDDLSRRAAKYVDKILKGAKPADLPIEQPTKFELAVNLKTAKALGLALPQSLLLRADHVVVP